MIKLLAIIAILGVVLVLFFVLWSALAVASAREEEQRRRLAMKQMEGFTGVDIPSDNDDYPAEETESE